MVGACCKRYNSKILTIVQDAKAFDQPGTPTMKGPKYRKRARQENQSRRNEDVSARRPGVTDLKHHDDANNPVPEVSKAYEEVEREAERQNSGNANPREVGHRAPEAPMYKSLVPDRLVQYPPEQGQPTGNQQDQPSHHATASQGPSEGEPAGVQDKISDIREKESRQQIPQQAEIKYEDGIGGPRGPATGASQSIRLGTEGAARQERNNGSNGVPGALVEDAKKEGQWLIWQTC